MLKLNDKSQVVYGVILSYILIFANALYGFIISPFIMFNVGMSDYGVYQSVASLSNALMVMDIGIGAAVMKFTAEYKAKGSLDDIGKLIKASFIISLLIVIFIILVGIFIVVKFPEYYGSSFTLDEISLAQEMIILFLFNIVIIFVDDIVVGVIAGMNRLVLTNSIRLAKVILRYLLILVLIPTVQSTIVIFKINIALTLLFFFVELVLGRSYLKYIKKKDTIDFSYLKKIFTYSSYIVIGGIINQINSSADNIIIGAKMGSYYVSIYSFALSLFAAYEHLATSISKNLLPVVTNIYENNRKNLDSFIVRIGRMQFMLLGGVLFGFIIIGKKFINCWLGSEFKDVYLLSLILLVPITLELCVNTCITILRAANKLGVRTIVLSLTAAINIMVTTWGVGKFGYIAAALGTAIAVIIGSLIIMNIYYNKELGINIIAVYMGIFKGILPCLFLAAIPTFMIDNILESTWISIILEVIVFLIFYVLSLFYIGANNYEKDKIVQFIHNLGIR